MFKAMIMLTRSENQTAAQFANWWTVQHAPLARQLPRLRKLVFNLIEGGDDSGPDGIAELWFDSQADFDAAYATDIGEAVANDSLDNVSSREKFLVNEHEIFP